VSADDPANRKSVEQAILNREADKRLLGAFVSGLRGVPGKHVRSQMPDTIDRALNVVIIASNAGTSERDGEKEESSRGRRRPWKFTGTQ
jgi:hypothetical protein